MTESIRISNAKGLYLEGIRDGHMVEALDKYTTNLSAQRSLGLFQPAFTFHKKRTSKTSVVFRRPDCGIISNDPRLH